MGHRRRPPRDEIVLERDGGPDERPIPEHRRDAAIEYLSGFSSPRRLQRIHAVLAERTRWLTVVLEDVYQPHNASAVLRSCECFGVQEVHIYEGRNDYTVHRDIALGAARWLDLERWRADRGQSFDTCCDHLEARGYRLVATTPRDDAVPLEDFDVTGGPAALLFGTELDGLTPAALARATEAVHIPMQGFTESLNISVSAALTLRETTRRLRASQAAWRLDEADRRAVLLRWLRRSLKHGEPLVERFLQETDR